MPIENIIDNTEKIIFTICSGTMRDEDFDLYVKRIWGNDQYYEFNELFDTVQADWSKFDFGYLLGFAKEAAKLTTINPDTKLAWVVLEGKQKQLTDFYKSAKSLTNVKSRALVAFYSKEEALEWLKA